MITFFIPSPIPTLRPTPGVFRSAQANSIILSEFHLPSPYPSPVHKGHMLAETVAFCRKGTPECRPQSRHRSRPLPPNRNARPPDQLPTSRFHGRRPDPSRANSPASRRPGNLDRNATGRVWHQ